MRVNQQGNEPQKERELRAKAKAVGAVSILLMNRVAFLACLISKKAELVKARPF